MWNKILGWLKAVWQWILSAWKWIRTDGLLHICVAALIVCAFGWIRPVWIPAMISLVACIAKEIYDYLHPDKHTAEWHDVYCDLIGIAAGVVIVLLNHIVL